MRKKDIDLIDLRILNTLQHNARRTNADLSEEIGLTAPNTLIRTNNLIKKGVLRIIGLLNYAYFGYVFRSLVVVRLPSQQVDNLVALLKGDAYVLRVHILKTPDDKATARRSVMYEAIAKSERSFVDRITRQFSALPYYDQLDFDLFPIAKVVKDVTYVELTPDEVG